MNLSLYSIQAFVVLDTEGNRVLSKYYRSKSHPQGESKELLTLKEQKVFEKGLWQKTKKPGGVCVLFCVIVFNFYAYCGFVVTIQTYRRYHSLWFSSRGIQTLFRPHSLLHRWFDGKWSYAVLCSHFANGRVDNAPTKLTWEARRLGKSRFGVTLLGRDDRRRVRTLVPLA